MALVNHSHASTFWIIRASSNESPVKHAEYYTHWNIIKINTKLSQLIKLKLQQLHFKEYLRRDTQSLKKLIKFLNERSVIYWLHFQLVISAFYLDITKVLRQSKKGHDYFYCFWYKKVFFNKKRWFQRDGRIRDPLYRKTKENNHSLKKTSTKQSFPISQHIFKRNPCRKTELNWGPVSFGITNLKCVFNLKSNVICLGVILEKYFFL